MSEEPLQPPAQTASPKDVRDYVLVGIVERIQGGKLAVDNSVRLVLNCIGTQENWVKAPAVMAVIATRFLGLMQSGAIALLTHELATARLELERLRGSGELPSATTPEIHVHINEPRKELPEAAPMAESWSTPDDEGE